ncbi:unnamed protein product [Dimorphilus gyrociliatus]|uniref:Uncharacterized protein n=1 Tax=Dimorphilus gyrociliatus TaxID=2664684 RepID=A0A7I8VQG5_9ANNE|nr:unnamed protein product [Dimorphilus gyrociliatus]
MENGRDSVSCVLIGDDNVGKSCLVKVLTDGKFLKEVSKTIQESYSKLVVFREKCINLIIHETAGEDKYKILRSLWYSGSDIAIICFSTVDRASFENIFSKWLPEITQYFKGKPILLVGTKSDLKKGSVKNPLQRRSSIVSFNEGCRAAEEIGAAFYLECSSRKDSQSVWNVFEKSIELTFLPQQFQLKKKKINKTCSIQ